MARDREGGRRQLDSPLGLLALGYAMAAVGAFVVAMIGGGLAALLLTFWLGGALATLFCALVWVRLSTVGRAREKHTDRYAAYASASSAR